MNPKIKKLFRNCALLLLCSIICIVSFLLYNSSEYNYPYIEPTIDDIQYCIERPDWSNKITVKEEIDALFDNPKYTLVETTLVEPFIGLSDINKNIIYIRYDLILEDYVFVLTHEITHVHYCTQNERKTNLIAWKILFFSDNNYFKNIALRYAYKDLKGYVDYEYSILGYIEDYLI